MGRPVQPGAWQRYRHKYGVASLSGIFSVNIDIAYFISDVKVLEVDALDCLDCIVP